MVKGKKLRIATDYFHPFPDTEDVFASCVQQHAHYLLPIAIIELNCVFPECTGSLPIVLPIEPAAGWGYLGDKSARYHNYLCRPNWIGYRLIDSKLELASDFRFFHKAFFESHPPQNEHATLEAQALAHHYDAIRIGFEQRREFFRENGFVAAENLLPLPLVDDLGGQCLKTNWAATDFPISVSPDLVKRIETEDVLMQEDNVLELTNGLPVALPRTEDGRDFIYVGCIEMDTYVDEIDGGMLIFFDPHEQIALTTFDWS